MSFSNIGFLTSTLRYLDNNQRLFELADYRLATSTKYSRIQDYGRMANRVLDLQLIVGQYDSYQESIKHTQINLEAYNSSLTALSEVASQITRWSNDVPGDISDTIWSQNTSAFVKGALLNIQEELNTEIAGRYIYGGSNVNTPPVKTLLDLALFGAGDSIAYDPSSGKRINVQSPIETGTNPSLLNRVPQYRYSSQDLANVKHIPNLYLDAGGADTFYVDPSSFTLGSADTLDIRVTLPGGAALPTWVQYDSNLKSINVQLPVGTTTNTTLQVEAKNDKGETITQLVDIVPTANLGNIPSVTPQTNAPTYVAGKTFTNLDLLKPSEVSAGTTGAGPVTVNVPNIPTTTTTGYTIPAGTLNVTWSAGKWSAYQWYAACSYDWRCCAGCSHYR